MSVAINRITNANLYINGTNLLGRAEELTLPDIKMKMSEHKAIGMVGSMEFPSGIEKLEAKIKWNSFYADAYSFAGNPYKTVQIQVRASIENYDASGRTGETPLVVFLVGQFKNIPTGTFKQHDNVEYESTMSVTAVKQIVNGVTVLDYDALSNTFRQNGQDLLAAYRANTGA